MKFWKHTLITAFAFIGLSTTVLYTSCEKDSCLDLKCMNGGACVEGFCRCPSGYEGTECETQVATKFIGRFIGYYTCPDNPPIIDTVDVWLLNAPNQVKLVNLLNRADTLSGTVTGTELKFDEVVDESYRRYTKAEMNGNKMTMFIEEVLNTGTGAKRTCNFIGFK